MLSSICKLVVSIAVVVPLTVRLPATVKLLIPDIFLLASKITALPPNAVPAVIPSTRFNSAAVEVIAVPPIDNLPVGTSKVALSFILATSVPSYCWKINSPPSCLVLKIAVVPVPVPPTSMFKYSSVLFLNVTPLMPPISISKLPLSILVNVNVLGISASARPFASIFISAAVAVTAASFVRSAAVRSSLSK